MSTVRANGAELYYETRGAAGDPVVLVHGSLVDHHTWDAVVGPLAEALQVIAYDRRGYGRSTGPRRVRSVRDDTEDLAGLLQATELYPAHIVTHSYAGAMAFRLAQDRPEMVRSIAVHEPPMVGLLEGDPGSASEARQWLGAIAHLRGIIEAGERESAARTIVESFSVQPGAWERLPPEVRALTLRHVGLWADEFADREAVEPDREGLRDLLIPVLLTTGEQSPPFLRRIVQQLAGLLRNATQSTFLGAGHAPQVTAPSGYLGVVGTFLLERNVPTV
jgi:pimeloyl-ACP methyl ester carboxylesterase